MLSAWLLIVGILARAGAQDFTVPRNELDEIQQEARATAFRVSIAGPAWWFGSTRALTDDEIRSLDLEIGVPKERLIGMKEKVGLQKYWTCEYFAVAAYLTASGRAISGMEVMSTALKLAMPEQLPAEDIERALNPIRHKVDPRFLAAKLGLRFDIWGTGNYVARVIFGNSASSYDAKKYNKSSLLIRDQIEKKLKRGLPMVVAVLVVRPEREILGMHVVAALGRTRDGRAILYDSNFGVIAVPWDAFRPFRAGFYGLPSEISLRLAVGDK